MPGSAATNERPPTRRTIGSGTAAHRLPGEQRGGQLFFRSTYIKQLQITEAHDRPHIRSRFIARLGCIVLPRAAVSPCVSSRMSIDSATAARAQLHFLIAAYECCHEGPLS